MAQQTNIEWTDFNWNFLTGCSRKSAGCENCYAEKMTKRLDAMGQEKYKGLLNKQGRFNGTVKFSEDDLLKPLSWKKPRRVFVNSMSDLFHEKVKDEWLDKAFAVMALTPHITYQILTKRPERMREYFRELELRHTPDGNMSLGPTTSLMAAAMIGGFFPEDGGKALDAMCIKWPLRNVWLGVSVEDQKTADERIPLLLQTPAAVRWISAEPLLGPVRLDGFLKGKPSHSPWLDWIVVGGESGPNARPFDIQWARDIIAQCKSADVPVFMKQIGGYAVDSVSDFGDPDGDMLLYADRKGGDPSEWTEDLRVREFPKWRWVKMCR